jgi:hypothetical protein
MQVKAFSFDSLSNSFQMPSIDSITKNVETAIKVKEEISKLDLDFDSFKHKIDDEYNIDIDAITRNVDGIT